jgi:V8-like Glu-specific endopeptidase
LEAYFGTLGFDFNWQEASYYKEMVEKDKSMKVVEIYGYPLLYDGPEYRLFKGSAYNDQNYLLYTMNTKGGVSGAPVLLHHGDCSTIRGIHVRDVSGMLQFAGKGALKLSHQMLVDISDNAS